MKMKTIAVMALAAMTFAPMRAQSQLIEQLTGQWKFVASPFDGGSDEVTFTAKASADGKSLLCHADQFITRASQPYAMDWQMTIEQNNNQVRVGWVLNADTPASEQEFQEAANKYVLFGKDADGSHRYIYLLSENIETHKLEGMTLWSDWQSADATTFALPRTQQIYCVVSQNIPYNSTVGYAEVWACAKVQKLSADAITEVKDNSSFEGKLFNLQGRALQQKPQRGLYIQDGKVINAN